MSKHTVGIDFGTESARAVLVDVTSGRVTATATVPFPHGVIDASLPGQTERLPPDWALQHTKDWLGALEHLLRTMAQHADSTDIIGIGVDFTSCTVLPATAEGTPLCLLPDFAHHPHAWPKLWKHHAAQPYADRINAARTRAGGAFLEFYGGKTSSEWLWAKGWQVLAESPAVATSMARWIEGGDWIVWQLTGTETRSACQAGYKAHWQKDSGYPDGAFLRNLDPALPQLLDRLAPPHPVARRAGGLLSVWAARTGPRPGTPIAVAVIDAHAAMPAVGAGEAGVMALDWWNGCRTPLVDADLSGLLVGLTVATEPYEIYRALLESTAFGTRRVIETFEAGGVTVTEVIACGGLAERNALLLQLTADIIGREVLASPVQHASAVGAAIYAAAAAGGSAGGYLDLRAAIRRMGGTERTAYRPRPAEQRLYESLYRDYLDLARHFGEGGTTLMKRLRRLRAG